MTEYIIKYNDRRVFRCHAESATDAFAQYKTAHKNPDTWGMGWRLAMYDADTRGRHWAKYVNDIGQKINVILVIEK